MREKKKSNIVRVKVVKRSHTFYYFIIDLFIFDISYKLL